VAPRYFTLASTVTWRNGRLLQVASRVEVLRATDLLGGAPTELLLSFAEAMDEATFAPGMDIMVRLPPTPNPLPPPRQLTQC